MPNVKNMPEYAKNHKYIVVREVEREFWFYGAYDAIDKAERIAEAIDGYIFTW